MLIRLTAALLLAFAAAPLAAQQIDCAAPVSQLDLTRCAERDWQRADVELNTAYKMAIAKARKDDAGLSDEQKGAEAALRTAQRAWIPFRDAACEYEGFRVRGGSAEPMVVYFCLARLTQQRVQDLSDSLMSQ
jgi:uncharacterized protein YecT (DUF1311 family)